MILVMSIFRTIISRLINTRSISDGAVGRHLLQEAEQEVSGGGVVGEEAEDGFMQHVGVQTAAGGR